MLIGNWLSVVPVGSGLAVKVWDEPKSRSLEVFVNAGEEMEALRQAVGVNVGGRDET